MIYNMKYGDGFAIAHVMEDEYNNPDMHELRVTYTHETGGIIARSLYPRFIVDSAVKKHMINLTTKQIY